MSRVTCVLVYLIVCMEVIQVAKASGISSQVQLTRQRAFGRNGFWLDSRTMFTSVIDFVHGRYILKRWVFIFEGEHV